jgi:hypothetical protein
MTISLYGKGILSTPSLSRARFCSRHQQTSQQPNLFSLSRRSSYSPAQFPVEHEERVAIVSNHPQRFQDFGRIALFLNLFLDESVQHHLGGIIALFDCQLVEIVDHRRHLALVFERLLEDAQRRFELDRRLVNGVQHDAPSTLTHKVEELSRALSLPDSAGASS